MVALLGLLTIVLLLALVMTKKASPVIALIIVPVVMALIGGFGADISKYITDGVKSIASTGVMFIFAILFFGILTDAGTFEPIIKGILKVVGKDPAKITIGTALLAMLVHLDGSGAVTFLIVIPAMLPLYDALKMKRSTLATVTALAAGTMNIVPWGGPTLRAATALGIPVTELFNPMLIPVVVGLLFVLAVAYYLGRKERKALGVIGDVNVVVDAKVDAEKQALMRPKLFPVNIILIIAAIVVLISGKVQPHVVFMVAFCIALVLNYPKVKDQGSRIDAHAKAALMMASILFAAGAFTGILKGTGMIKAMADTLVKAIPAGLGARLPLITGILSMPLSLVFDPDSFYFGVLPVLSSTAAQFGVQAVDVARAAILGQMTTGFPVSPLTGSTFLLIGLAGVDLGEHQKKTIPFAFLTTIVMLFVAILIGKIPL
jgi:citrate-Mg2+:H+ or citrate-Ca2+:H+ symporter, CitMHS family